MNNIAILITCFNRRKRTLKCLDQLFACKNDVDVYLVDDLSNDGTAEAIKLQYPQVNLISGTGNLYWNRGMLRAWSEAEKKNYDFYIWLNDDVVLYKLAFDELIDCSHIADNRAIISGIIETEDKSAIIYGGSDDHKRLIVPNGRMNEITYLNGNVVLVPKYVYNKIGKLDPVYHHDLGDVDYGLQARKNIIKVYTTRIPVAFGEKNNFCRIRLWNSSLIKRFKKLYSPLGNPPKINFHFRKKHFGLANAIRYYLFLYLINLLPDSIVKLCWGKKYISQ